MFDNLINNLSGFAATEEGDYRDENGILICGKCHEPKEFTKEYPAGSGKIMTFQQLCKCGVKEREREEERKKQQALINLIDKLRQMGITDKAYLKRRFQADDRRNPELTNFCQEYVFNWDSNHANNRGVLFYGPTGGGKSFLACCIANALIERGVPALVTRLSDLVKNRTDDKTPDINLNQFELIVIDDLGVENPSQTAYNIIDDIYRADITLIVTTNLTPKDIKNANTLEKKRIYDRILERCGNLARFVPVAVDRLTMAKQR